MLSPPSVEFDISDLLRNGFDESVARELMLVVKRLLFG
jgi:hypothetical protein